MGILSDNSYIDFNGRRRVRTQQPPYMFDGILETMAPLYHADPECDHEAVRNQWSGVECRKCGGWFCF